MKALKFKIMVVLAKQLTLRDNFDKALKQSISPRPYQLQNCVLDNFLILKGS